MSRLIYTDPKLCTYGDDLTRAWFVYFTITDPDTNEKVTKQFRGGINYYHTVDARKREGKALVAYWKKRLREGTYCPFKKKRMGFAVVPDDVTAAVKKIVEIKSRALRSSSKESYKKISERFLRWLADNRLATVKLHAFTREHAQAYLDHLLLDMNYNGKTHNNQRSVMHAIFAQIVERWEHAMPKNPFSKIPELPEDVGKNVAYSEREKHVLIEYFKLHDKRMYYAVNFIYHAYIRKTELCDIQVRDIDWVNKTIRIASSTAKNRLQDSVTITEGLEKILLEMGLDMAPGHYYVFGKRMMTCEQQCTRPSDISDRHRALKLAAGLPDDPDKTFYSWKHTGVVDYYQQIKDPYAIMRQCRHSDIKTTMIYMKSLGLNPNAEFRRTLIHL